MILLPTPLSITVRGKVGLDPLPDYAFDGVSGVARGEHERVPIRSLPTTQVMHRSGAMRARLGDRHATRVWSRR
jgi:hypothetical protein